MEEYGISENCILYARNELYVDNLVAIKITIDENSKNLEI